jgi:hypothetical protein
LLGAEGLGCGGEAVHANLVDEVDEGLSLRFEGLDGGGAGEGDVADLAAGLGGLVVEVQVDIHVVVEGVAGHLGQLEVGRGGGPAENIEHDGRGDPGGQLGGHGQVKNCMYLCLVLRHVRDGLNGVVA